MFAIPDKESFLKEIGGSTEYNEQFYKKVYGYSICDKSLLPAVASKLIGMGRKDVIEAYNEWFLKWQAENNRIMKNVAFLYHKEQQRLYRDLFKEEPERKVNAKCTKEELLLQKKKLLLQKKKLLMQKSMR
jgi:hypothetical protein